jgi:hypothetical protein
MPLMIDALTSTRKQGRELMHLQVPGNKGGGGGDLLPSQTRAILNEIHHLKS